MQTMKNQLQFIICDAMQLGLILPYFVILYGEGNTAFIKYYNQFKLLISRKKTNPTQTLEPWTT